MKGKPALGFVLDYFQYHATDDFIGTNPLQTFYHILIDHHEFGNRTGFN